MAQLMGINEAARYLGVCPDTVRRHIRLGLLQARQKPRGTKYQWLVEVPEMQEAAKPDTGERVHSHHQPPTVEEYERLQQLVDDLRHLLGVATTELDARRSETARLLALLERAQR